MVLLGSDIVNNTNFYQHFAALQLNLTLVDMWINIAINYVYFNVGGFHENNSNDS